MSFLYLIHALVYYLVIYIIIGLETVKEYQNMYTNISWATISTKEESTSTFMEVVMQDISFSPTYIFNNFFQLKP